MNVAGQLFSRIFDKLVALAVSLCLVTPSPAWAVDAAQPDNKDGDTGETEAAAPPPPKKPVKIEVNVGVNVPLNANARDKIDLLPYPTDCPPVTEADYHISTKPEDLRKFLKSAFDYKWGKAGQTPPDWRVDRALQQGLLHSRMHLPQASEDAEVWLDEFLPYFRSEVKAINAQEYERYQRFLKAKSFESARAAFQEDAEINDKPAFALRIRQIARGIREDKAFVKPGIWWAVGTHTLSGLTYYWQEQRSISEGPPRLIELTEQNALLIRGHY
jgi:hypothetical protein